MTTTTDAPPVLYKFEGQPWAPAVYTRPLSDDFATDGDRLLAMVDLAWSSPDSPSGFSLDQWQRALIRHVLERYPADHPLYPGELRYKQVVISVARQNGKSVLGAILALYGLTIHCTGPEVISLASSVKQANIIFRRTSHVFANHPTLRNRFKATGTRGIRSRVESRPASYNVLPAVEDSLQGVVASLGLFDELHISPEEAWDALVIGAIARLDSLVAGITTAGDDSSTLLIRLYDDGRAAARGEGDERFGFFCWEAPTGCDVLDPDAIKAANPSVAEGRRALEATQRLIAKMPVQRARRYMLNQFVTGTDECWLPDPSVWADLDTADLDTTATGIYYAVERTLNWTAATITANTKTGDGTISTELVATLSHPTIDTLEATCAEIHASVPGEKFVMDSYTLKDLSNRLRAQGIPTEYLTIAQVVTACSTAAALVSERRVRHAHDPLVCHQVPVAVAKTRGEGWLISRRDSPGDIDACLATVYGIYAAETMQPAEPGLWVG